jgi:hypothetical protein
MAPPDPEESVAADQAGLAAAADGSTGKAGARGRYRDALRHRDFRLLVASFLVDQAGVERRSV